MLVHSLLTGLLIGQPYPLLPIDEYQVEWTEPSADSSGSTPLGNGSIGLNLWVEPSGDIVFYISTTDAWDENCRLLKLGRVRVKLDPPLRTSQPAFSQRLALGTGEVVLSADSGAGPVETRVWVDANAPVVRVEATTAEPSTLSAEVEIWRTAPRELTETELGQDAARLAAGQGPVISHPDTILTGDSTDRVVWCHRNESSVWPFHLTNQGLESLIPQLTDPLLNRTFGALMAGPGLRVTSPSRLESREPARNHLLEVHVLTAQTATVEEWRGRLDEQARATQATGLSDARKAHRVWWREFWNRSWIVVSPESQRKAALTAPVERNTLPLRVGADSNGANQFSGDIEAPGVYSRALSPMAIAAIVADGRAPGEGLAWRWTSGDARAKTEGTVEVADGRKGPCLHLTGAGWVEVANSPEIDFGGSCTLEAWVRPEQLPEGGARIIDKSQAGTDNGYLLDTCPGNSLRMILNAGTLRCDAKLPAGEWSHVAGTYDAATGIQRLYVNGEIVAEQQAGAGLVDVSLGYTLQRYIAACGGRGAYPIKFNGSIFTVEPRGEGLDGLDPDFRRWGGAYWFQNTRLPYWAMLASGDYDTMQPLFRMFMDALPLARARTPIYFGHEGAYFPETMPFWGAWPNGDYGLGREGKPPSEVDNPYIKRHYNNTLELLAMMLDYYAYTRDGAFARDTLLPFVDAIIPFWDKHYGRDAAGHIRMEPAQSLETYWDVVNPAQDVAGLRWDLARLLELPGDLVRPERRAYWAALAPQVPELPSTDEGGARRLTPAGEVRCGRTNIENPELYAVWPYRLYGVGKPDLGVGLATWQARPIKSNSGWQQDPIQAAHLGLAREAAEMVADRFSRKHAGSRFPAFWGPNFDWVPDQDHGSVGLTALQDMLLQADGRRILLFPAWPREWDVSFKLHAPENTTVECGYRDGKVVRLEVSPASRRADVEVLEPQP